MTTIRQMIKASDIPLVMGILNITPDSFSDSNRYFDVDNAVKRAIEIEKEGANIIDIGGQSTKPGHTCISCDAELERLNIALPLISKAVSIPISVDTFYPNVAEFALQNGASIINDVSGAINLELLHLVEKHNANYVLMYNQAGGATSAHSFFIDKLNLISDIGIPKENIVLDPGIGFNKNYQNDLELIKNVSDYSVEDYPVLMGLSRKRVVSNSSGLTLKDNNIDVATLVANLVSAYEGANIIRVHDVAKTLTGLKTFYTILRGETNGQNYN